MSDTLIIIIYIALIIFIMVLCAVGIKLVGTLMKVDILLDDVTSKMKTLDKTFSFIDVMNDKLTILGETIIGVVSGGIKGLLKNIKKDKESEEEENE